ncbi:hypothetical protein BN1723_007760 [Verticillium longisporum]|uniref:CBS domain-containing protein n=1 Tax=Verticillium longisporum TaxID=100787 RepID=A0A0G4NMU0_VERLO|nr:hypothetical protein BN1723_007760 [Verticillium longisporum]
MTGVRFGQLQRLGVTPKDWAPSEKVAVFSLVEVEGLVGGAATDELGLGAADVDVLKEDLGGGLGNGHGLGDGDLLVDVAAGLLVITRIEDLVVLTATGHTIASLTAILDANPHRGFPVISDPREAILLGYISRAELSYNLRSSAQPPRSLPPETEAFFTHQPMADPSATLDLRPWMDQTPITLPSRANLHLVVSYFQKLGLRYVLFADRGVLQGLLTKKDVWYVLNGADETRRTAGTSGRDGTVETGITRENGDGEAEGLLRERSGSEAMSPAHERGPML